MHKKDKRIDPKGNAIKLAVYYGEEEIVKMLLADKRVDPKVCEIEFAALRGYSGIVKLLLADIHGALDNTPWDLLEKRYEYYSLVVPAMFKAIGADIKNFEIVKGSDFQMKKESE